MANIVMIKFDKSGRPGSTGHHLKIRARGGNGGVPRMSGGPKTLSQHSSIRRPITAGHTSRNS